MSKKEDQKEREELIIYLRGQDTFFQKTNFSHYTIEELREFKTRWADIGRTEKPRSNDTESDNDPD